MQKHSSFPIWRFLFVSVLYHIELKVFGFKTNIKKTPPWYARNWDGHYSVFLHFIDEWINKDNDIETNR